MTPLAHLRRYLRPHQPVIVLTWLISIGVLALQALSVWIGAGFIERLLSGRPGSLGALEGVGNLARELDRLSERLLTRSTPFRSLAAALALLGIIGLLAMALRVTKTALFARLTQAVLLRIRCDVFDHLTRLDLSFSRRHRPGETASLLIRDVESLHGGIIDLCDRVFMQPLRLLIAVAMLASLSPGLTAVFAVALLLCAGGAHLAGAAVQRLAKGSMERVARVQGFLTEYLTTVLLARSLGRETREKRKFADLCGELALADRKLTVTDSLAPQLVDNLFLVAGSFILLGGGYRVLVTHTMEPGVLLRFMLCLPLAFYPVESLALLYVSLRRSLASAHRVFSVFDEAPAAADRPGAIDPPAPFSEIAFESVSFRPDGNPVLEGLSFRIRRGQRVLVSGASGTGKTTVLHLLAGVIRPSAGRVAVEGVDLAACSGEHWRRRIGIVPQEPLMMNGTVAENLRFACETADDARLAALLREIRFGGDEESCRQILARPVGNRGEFLSGGERQRLAIARALLIDPLLLLLDEPVAHLDEANRLRVRESILALPATVTVVFTSHDRTLHDLADQVIELDGRKPAPGGAS